MTVDSSIKCIKCEEEFNNISRRPKALPCSHNMCTPCIENYIESNMKECIVCNKSFDATSAEDIPVNTAVENLIVCISQFKVDILKKYMGRLKPNTSTLNKYVSNKTEIITKNEEQVQILQKDIEDDTKTKDEALKDITENKIMSHEIKAYIEKINIENDGNINSVNGSEVDAKIETLKEHIKSIEEKYEHQFGVWEGLLKVDAKPVVYLDLELGGKPLGRVRIMLTCGPKRREEMLWLCLGQGGNTWKGAPFAWASEIGQPGENLQIWHYMTPSGEMDSALLGQHELEGNECFKHVEGIVTGLFNICTRTDPSSTDMDPVLGRVVSGLDLLREAISQLEANENTTCYDTDHFIISEAGVEAMKII